MAPKRPRFCLWPGCPNKITGTYCATHGAQRDLERDRIRGTAAERGYDAAWSKIRAGVITEEPWCRVCRAAPTTEVDHIIPLSQGGSHDRANLQGLCGSCHRSKTNDDNSAGHSLF